jgi:dTMP kinase
MKKSEVKLICFVGIDGSGKTTLANYLVNALEQNEIQCECVYGRLQPCLLKPFIFLGNKLFLKNADMFEDYKHYSDQKSRSIKKHPILSKLYSYALLLDYSFQILIRVRIPYMLGKTIICDRYVYDTIITDLSVDMNYSKSKMIGLIQRLFYLAPKPDLAFLIDLPEEIAFKRKNDTPSLDYLKERRQIYLDIGMEENMIILDGSADLVVLSELVEHYVFGHVNGRLHG